MHTLLINLSCSSACLANLRACLDNNFLVCTACSDSISLVWATLYTPNPTKKKKDKERKKETWNKTFTAYNRPKVPTEEKFNLFHEHIFHFRWGEEIHTLDGSLSLSPMFPCESSSSSNVSPLLVIFPHFLFQETSFLREELREGDCGSLFWFYACVCVLVRA